MAGTVRRLRGGGVRLSLTRREHAALAALPDQLRPLVTGEAGGDVAAAVRARLFPRAHAEDDLDREYRQLTADDLVAGRLDQLEIFARTLEGTGTARGKVHLELDADEAAAWLAVVNDTRLVLAAAIGITTEREWEDDPDPDDPASVLLWYLGWLEEGLVEALMGSLDP